MSELRVRIEYEYNDSAIEIVQTEYPLRGGVTNIENSVRKLTDTAKARFIAALRVQT